MSVTRASCPAATSSTEPENSVWASAAPVLTFTLTPLNRARAAEPAPCTIPAPAEEPRKARSTVEEAAPVRAVTATEISEREEEFSVLTEAPAPASFTEAA